MRAMCLTLLLLNIFCSISQAGPGEIAGGFMVTSIADGIAKKAFKCSDFESHLIAASFSLVFGISYTFFDDDAYPNWRAQKSAIANHALGTATGIFFMQAFSF